MDVLYVYIYYYNIHTFNSKKRDGTQIFNSYFDINNNNKIYVRLLLYFYTEMVKRI